MPDLRIEPDTRKAWTVYDLDHRKVLRVDITDRPWCWITAYPPTWVVPSLEGVTEWVETIRDACTAMAELLRTELEGSS